MFEPAIHGIALPDDALMKKFDVPAPRYTSYPTADRFKTDMNEETFLKYLQGREESAKGKGLSLYCHVPFCNDVCYYCGCNKVVTRDHGRAQAYLETMMREADLFRANVTGNIALEQLHWGGGTPTFLTNDEISYLMESIQKRFPIAPNAEVSVEVDPRSCPDDKVRTLRRLGFNRMSLGVQDFNPDVQKAVNRIQPFELVRSVFDSAREAGFQSINTDLIYGLPKQNRDTFRRTIEQIIELGPDRIALYHYAHLPNHFKPQRMIMPADLPGTTEKVGIMFDAIRTLTANGYRYIGMDHFAKETDELTIAQENGTIQRNFQGYSTNAECDMIALGASSISFVNGCYACNPRDIDPWAQAINEGHLATNRGFALSDEDKLRRAVIMTVMCRFEIDKAEIEREFGINFDETFAYELRKLRVYEAHELVRLTPEKIIVGAKGKIFVRAVAMQFDRYLRESDRAGGYSRIA